MKKESDYTFSVKPFYQGGYSSIDPNKSPFYTGAKVSAGDIGMGTDARTANVAQEISSKLSTGARLIELNQVSPEVFEAVPDEQLKEVKREAKLTNADITFHAPIIGRDPSGLTQQGRFEDSQREIVERQMVNAIERGSQLSDDKPVTITFHAAEGVPGTEVEITKQGEVIKKLPIVNRDTGQLVQQLEREKLHYPHEMGYLNPKQQEERRKVIEDYQAEKISQNVAQEKLNNIMKKEKKISLEEGKEYTPEMRLKSVNATEWDNSLNQLFFNKERADEILSKAGVQIKHIQPEILKGDIPENELTPEQISAKNSYQNAETYIEDIRQNVESQFNRAYKYSSEEDKKKLKEFSERYKKELGDGTNIFNQSRALNNLLINMKKITPEIHVSAQDYILDRSSETFGNAAFNAYKAFKSDKKLKGKKMPVIAIENSYAGGAFSRGSDLKNVIEESRKKFIEKLKQDGLNEKKAKKIAEQTIGATWDTGRLNLLRKYGFSEEDILKETKAIAPYVKHTHLSDNFGFEGSESAPGTGNVPFKEIFKTLDKGGAEGRKIVEAMHWYQHFKAPPTTEAYEALGSSIYSQGSSPYWYQVNGLQQGYLGGMEGAWIPEMNYQTFGAGFIPLSMELGAGQKGQGTGGRVSGRPME
ncbi:MAG: TIM barrel protein [Nanoarchaeota archaeon]